MYGVSIIRRVVLVVTTAIIRYQVFIWSNVNSSKYISQRAGSASGWCRKLSWVGGIRAVIPGTKLYIYVWRWCTAAVHHDLSDVRTRVPGTLDDNILGHFRTCINTPAAPVFPIIVERTSVNILSFSYFVTLYQALTVHGYHSIEI